MTTQEFSNEFDVLYGNIVAPNAPALDEYEKSVFLTKAQSEILKEYFNARVDSTDGGFDGSQKRQYDFSKLIVTTQLTAKTGSNTKIDIRSGVYEFPTDYFLSVNEIMSLQDTRKQYSIVPITYSEYQRLMSKPYPYPPKNILWRIFTSTTEKQDSKGNKTQVPVAEIIGNIDTSHTPIYTLRYIQTPSPIILVDLTNDNLSIEGVKTVTNSQLPEELHKDILERAVTLAKIAYQAGSTSSIVAQQQQQERNNRR